MVRLSGKREPADVSTKSYLLSDDETDTGNLDELHGRHNASYRFSANHRYR